MDDGGASLQAIMGGAESGPFPDQLESAGETVGWLAAWLPYILAGAVALVILDLVKR